jgi:hypothetical protein
MAGGQPRKHHFHGEAEVLNAQLQLPLLQDVKSQAYVKLPDEGGYRSEQAHNYRLEGVLSFREAYTQVAGNRSVKDGRGWITLVTSVVIGLNVLDVVTADRVVAQMSTEHPLEGYVPTVTFLGTRFENLRIGGHEVDPTLNLGICGPKPANDGLYILDPSFLGRVSHQYAAINKAKGVPAVVQQRYNTALLDPVRIQKAQAEAAAAANKQVVKPKIECSLVDSAASTASGTAFGHIIVVPGFGTVSLAELTVEDDSFHLTMINLDLGCLADGKAKMCNTIVNGKTVP